MDAGPQIRRVLITPRGADALRPVAVTVPGHAHN